MRYIKLCKTYKNLENPDIKTIIEKYGFMLERSKYSSKIIGNKIIFMHFFNYKYGQISSDRYKGAIILRNGTINLKIRRKSLIVCWKIPIITIWFRAFLFGLIFSLPFYFMSTNKNINDTIVLFVSVFLITSIISFITLKIKVTDINRSVL